MILFCVSNNVTNIMNPSFQGRSKRRDSRAVAHGTNRYGVLRRHWNNQKYDAVLHTFSIHKTISLQIIRNLGTRSEDMSALY
jgi:hypothetical protein